MWKLIQTDKYTYISLKNIICHRLIGGHNKEKNAISLEYLNFAPVTLPHENLQVENMYSFGPEGKRKKEQVLEVGTNI